MKRCFAQCCAVVCLWLLSSPLVSGQTARSGPQTRTPQLRPPAQQSGTHVVEFEVHTAISGLGEASNDLILIVFSGRSAAAPLVAFPLFGEDILAEFAFSGRDARPGRALVFSRRVNDLSFLNARYIRIVNHGMDGWAGESLSLTVDGRRVLERQRLYPRSGAQTEGGIEKFNSGSWTERNLWEAELQRIRVDRSTGAK